MEIKNELNNKNLRLLNLDLLKVVAIVFMVLCHAVDCLATHKADYENEIGFIVGDTIFGSYMAVAHAFMFSMGVGVIYSRRQEPKCLIKRGIFILILAYILNFFRYGIYALGDGIIEGKFYAETDDAFFVQDILHFAGLALMFTGLLKLLKLKSIYILLIAIILSMIGGPLAFVINYNKVVNYFVGFFLYTEKEVAYFSFFNWYIFVAVGLVFGEILLKIKNKDKFYKYLLIISSLICIIYVVLTIIFGFFFITKNNWYFATSILESIGLLSIDFTLLSLFYFVLKNKDDTKKYWFVKISKNLTIIYFIHWCIFGFIDSIFGYLLEIQFPYLSIFTIGVVVLFVSILLSDIYVRIRNKRKIKKMGMMK